MHMAGDIDAQKEDHLLMLFLLWGSRPCLSNKLGSEWQMIRSACCCCCCSYPLSLASRIHTFFLFTALWMPKGCCPLEVLIVIAPNTSHLLFRTNIKPRHLISGVCEYNNPEGKTSVATQKIQNLEQVWPLSTSHYRCVLYR